MLPKSDQQAAELFPNMSTTNKSTVRNQQVTLNRTRASQAPIPDCQLTIAAIDVLSMPRGAPAAAHAAAKGTLLMQPADASAVMTTD